MKRLYQLNQPIKVESTEMRKLSSDKTTGEDEEQHVLSKPSEHDKETRIDLSLQELIQTARCHKKKDSSDGNK